MVYKCLLSNEKDVMNINAQNAIMIFYLEKYTSQILNSLCDVYDCKYCHVFKCDQVVPELCLDAVGTEFGF